MVDNILSEPQRETSGASTFGKYEFQFHWALCKIIEKHKKSEDYALLIEYHEDVVIADSLDVTQSNFDFYQVKNKTGARYTVESLTKREAAKQGAKSSVLGKLLSSCIDTSYSDRISEIGLVASNGFNLDQQKNGLKLDIITSGHLSDDCCEILTSKIEAELGVDKLPENLKFIIPKIKLENQREYVIAEFADLVNTLFPNGLCNAVSIYRAIIDDIHRKGSITNDFTDWERLIDEKSLTSYKVQEVLALNTKHSSTEQIISDLNSIREEMGWSFTTFKKYRKNIERLVLERTGMLTALSLNRMKGIERAISEIDVESFDTLANGFNVQVSKIKLDFPIGSFNDDTEILSEALYHYLKD
jgi:hypothetical protein